MSPFLFVYGTLCPDCGGELGREERARLGRESILLGETSVRGRMLDLGTYPGLVAGSGWISGTMLRLTRPQTTVVWLDRYEDATGGPNAQYVRVLECVGAPAGGMVRAWLYRLRRIPIRAQVLNTGIWHGRSIS